jgi:L-asparaginase II
VIRSVAAYRVVVRRGGGGPVDAEHRVTAVAWVEDGCWSDGAGAAPTAAAGEAGAVTSFRSCCKPFQALPLVERGHADRLGFSERDLAVVCASHSGAGVHVETVRGLLARLGLDESALLCGFHFPQDDENEAALRGGRTARSPVYNTCSGKHVGMLALALAEGWPMADYVALDHPVQRACMAATAEVCGVDSAAVAVGVDGCTAMQLHPVLVAGERRFDTDLMVATHGTLVSKGGAEALQCVAVPAERVGVTLKVHDGNHRAVGPAAIAFLAENGWLAPGAAAALKRWAKPALHNHRGLETGEVRAFPEAFTPFPAGAGRA